MGTVVQQSSVAAPAEEVWAAAISEEGINYELKPLLRMTMPKALRGKTMADVPVGEPLGRSWILLFGLIPVDYDDLSLAALGPGMSFHERSTMLSMTTWEHERSMEPETEGALVTDRLTFQLRRPLRWLPGSDRLATAIVTRFFAHRHNRLAQRYGAAQ